ncbi:MAG TPA: hypothetical protein VFS25_19480 [Chitinophaga sp.]|uniref:hypothetical protein n=1 Tax=Chitinophaga sp. TaxID=1869181 RepID=UPI002DB957DB|nr:hypothetical protein [Chitinophaga sp.]HEU4555042.1 hypothetical protein [Chitinophaga sp.]
MVELKGYYIKVYTKDYVRKLEQNRNNRLNNRPFQVAIDGSKYDEFFIPVSDSEGLYLQRELSTLFYRNKKSIYLRCTSANYAVFKEHFCNSNEDKKNDTCVSFVTDKYYSFSKDKMHCYQVFYVTGLWLEGKAVTNVQKSLFPEKAKYIDTSVAAFNTYLLYRLRKSDVKEIKDSQLELWKTVPPLWND